ncbi:MAG: isoleucine--tRNA ligase [Acidimicrobiia bacterium]
MYEGHRVVPYCGRCGTALSSHELGQPDVYRDIVDQAVFVRFPILEGAEEGAEGADLLVWTTTPWTLLSNVAVAVSPDLIYARVRATAFGATGRDVIVAETRLPEDAEAAVVTRLTGQQLVGARYQRPFDILEVPAQGAERMWHVYSADFVEADEGTGLVHVAPAFGEVDADLARAEQLPLLNPVDATASFDKQVPAWQGRFVKDVDADIVEELREKGLLVSAESYSHSYPHCWRCQTPLIYWAKKSWFLRTSEQRAHLTAENEKIEWYPPSIKTGRFGNWLANNVDWALSRDRYWGTPLPVWRCSGCSIDTWIGSVEELSSLARKELGKLDLHRPAIDTVEISCPTCGDRARRLPPVIDAWFDSGAMPAAQFHYPFENQALFERRFPADFICEAVDQTRGWFYSLLAVNTLVFDRAPYRNVVCLGLIVAGDGQKMSKSKGNVIDPWTVLETRGADALRWNLFSAGSPWTTRRVSEAGIDESTRRLLVTLWNTYSFFVTYANIDGWQPNGANAATTHALDRWARSRLHSTVREVTEALDGFDALRGALALDGLVDDLSNWYVRRSRPRFWRDSDPAAHATLHECMVTLAKLLAPYCPFIADELYGNLSGETDSVHLTDWPEADATAIDADLDAEMALARQVVSLGRAARIESKLKVRQPLRRALVVLPGGAALSEAVNAEVADELNVKQLEPIADLEGLLTYEVVPNFRALGPRAGSRMPKLKEALAATDGATVRLALAEHGAFEIEVDGETFAVQPDEVEVRAVAHDEFGLAQEGLAAVALDTVLDDELRLEGIAREVVRALNELRKTSGLEIADRIDVELRADGLVADALRAHRDWIGGEVLAETLEIAELNAGENAPGFSLLTLDAGAAWARLAKHGT